METGFPTVKAFVQVQRELNGAISVLRKEDENRKEDVVKSSAKVQQLERRVQKGAQLITDYETKLGEYRAQIDELKKSDLKLQIQLKDKNKMVKFLTKRVKVYDEILTKKQEEFASSMKKEKEVKRSFIKFNSNSLNFNLWQFKNIIDTNVNKTGYLTYFMYVDITMKIIRDRRYVSTFNSFEMSNTILKKLCTFVPQRNLSKVINCFFFF